MEGSVFTLMRIFHLYQIHTKLFEGLESLCTEMILWKRKWLVTCIYKPAQPCGKVFIEKLPNRLKDHHTSYDIILLLVDSVVILIT